MTTLQKWISGVVVGLLVLIAVSSVALNFKTISRAFGNAYTETNFPTAFQYTTTTLASNNLPIKLLSQDYARNYVRIDNVSSNDVYIYLASTTLTFNTGVQLATTSITSLNGIYLKASSSYELNANNLFTGEVWASSTASSKINVTYSD